MSEEFGFVISEEILTGLILQGTMNVDIDDGKVGKQQTEYRIFREITRTPNFSYIPFDV
jgi:hypothetical protein